MERKESNTGILNLLVQPAFTVQDGVIVQLNEAAQKAMLAPGMQISDILVTGDQEYKDFRDGCLYLTLTVADRPCSATVHRMDGFDLFTVEQDTEQAELQAMALAAQELRLPLSNVMAVADQLFPVADQGDNPVVQEQISRINRGLFQMLRMISNMSDAYQYSRPAAGKFTVQDITNILGEIFSESAQLLEHGSIKLHFTNLNRSILCLIDREKLERGVHNIISNAVKFSEKGSDIYAQLTCSGQMLYLTIRDSGSGIQQEHRGNIHNRFRRVPGLEDSRFGIGLGMLMIHAAAAAHGGTVLIDHPEGCGTRITMTLQLRQENGDFVKTTAMPVDYAGERSHSLIELSDVLPAELYQASNIN
ncbi:MAG: HAMP domain-containing histidine kinase [Ruminococcaceae bacterium]|nr:HAMP domain-containing histidine kinase [Oscillospiraceae bacterium]